MNAADYKRERQQRGTQASVAALLGLARETVARRETGALPIPREAELALLALQTKRRGKRASNNRDDRRRAPDSAQTNGA